MALIGTLVSFSPGTKIVSADVNSNFSAIRNAFNGSAVLNDTVNTITVTHTFSTGFIVSGGQIGGSVAFASGVTINSSGLTVTAGGISVVAGNVGIGSAVQTQNALRIVGSIVSGSVSQFGVSCDITGDSNATSEIGGAVFRAQTMASAYTVSSLYGLHIIDAVKGAGSTVTTQYGLKIDDQTKGTNRLALKTGLGLVELGDNVTCAAALNVVGALVVTGNATLGAALNVVGAITCSSISVSNTFSAAGFTATAGDVTVSAGVYSAVGIFQINVDGNVVMQASFASSVAIFSRTIRTQGGANIVPQSVTLTTSVTTGFVYLSTCPGTATGTPHTENGCVPMFFDTTNNRLQIYNGGWKTVALT